MCLLQHDTHRTAQRVLADVGDGDTVVEDLSFLDVVEAVDEVDDGGLTGSRTTYEGYLLSGVRVDVDIKKNLLFGGVAEVDISEVDIALRIGKFFCSMIHLGLGIHKAEHAFGSDSGVEYGVDLLGDVGDGLGETLVQGEEGHNGTQTNG